MKYQLTIWFAPPSPEAVPGFTRALSAWLRSTFTDALLAPRSRRLALTESNVAQLLSASDGYSSGFSFSAPRQSRPVTGRVYVPHFGYFPGAPATLELDFSLQPTFRQSPFSSASELASLLSTGVEATGGHRGEVRATDASPAQVDADYAIFQNTDVSRVPDRFHWITAVRTDLASALGWERLPTSLPDGSSVLWFRNCLILITCPERFSFTAGVGTQQRDTLERLFDLPACRERFRRTSAT